MGYARGICYIIKQKFRFFRNICHAIENFTLVSKIEEKKLALFVWALQVFKIGTGPRAESTPPTLYLNSVFFS